jgi:hypothetical protein
MTTSNEGRAARLAAAVYLPLALLAASAFTVAAALQARVGPIVLAAGAFWVGVLTLIVLMPVVIPRVRARVRGR